MHRVVWKGSTQSGAFFCRGEHCSPVAVYGSYTVNGLQGKVGGDGGYDPIYGARPLKRYIQSHVETMIAKEIIGGAHTAGDTLTVDADGNGQLILR